MFFNRIISVGAVFVLCASAQAGIEYEYEDFNGLYAPDYSDWIVGAFDGIADIQTYGPNHTNGPETLLIHTGPYDLNLNGNPILDEALANNFPNLSAYINFYEGYEWTSFSGIFSAALDDMNDAQVSFTFNNTDTLESTTVWADLTDNYDSLRALDFDLGHSFNQIEIYGDYVVMDNLMVAIPSPSVLALLGLAGISTRCGNALHRVSD